MQVPVKMSSQFDVSPEELKNLQLKAQRREALRAEFLKQSTDPHRHASGGGGTVFDPAIQRFGAMRVSSYEHFKPNAKNFRIGLCVVLIPMVAYGYLLKSSRDSKELQFRSGEIAYKDRFFKLI